MINYRVLLEIFQDFLEELEAHISMGHLTAPEHDCQLRLITLTQEPTDMTELEVNVMFLGFGSEFDLFEDYSRLFFLGLLGLFLL